MQTNCSHINTVLRKMGLTKSLIAIVILLFVSAQAYGRETRFWSLGIGIVRFENSICIGPDNLDGTCYTKRQCRSVEGFASGRCAKNIGVCCVVQRSCGEVSSYNNTYFTNRNYPNTVNAGSRCTLTIQKCNPDICQIRVDFLSFCLSQPNPQGVCDQDSLLVSGGAGPIPVICGDNSGQHIYVDFNGNDTIQLTVNIVADQRPAKNWAFKITQIACDCPTRAPTGCLMYYTALSGTVSSFNYGTTSNRIDPNTGLPGTRELVNENYGVCIAMAPGYCGIRWSSNSFVVSGDVMSLVNVPLSGEDCTGDFVVIPHPFYSNDTAANSDRFCGTAFNTVTSYSKPFVLTVVTNDNEINDTQNMGFSLNYMQIPCGNSMLRAV